VPYFNSPTSNDVSLAHSRNLTYALFAGSHQVMYGLW